MKNPFVLKSLSQGILKKKPNFKKAQIRQSFLLPLNKKEKYFIETKGSALLCLEGAKYVSWNDGDDSNCKYFNDDSFVFSCGLPPLGIEITLDSNDQELSGISIRNCLEMPNGELIVLEEEFIRNCNFKDTSEEYVFESEKNQNKIRWVQGYNKYIVRELD